MFLQVILGGPRPSRTKYPGEKEVISSALGATNINAVYSKGEKCVIMKLKTIVMRLRRFLLVILMCGNVESTGVALRAIATIGDV